MGFVCCQKDDRYIKQRAILWYNIMGIITMLVSLVSVPLNLTAFFLIDQAVGFFWIAGLISFIAGCCGVTAKVNSSAVKVFSIVALILSAFSLAVDGVYSADDWPSFQKLHSAIIIIDSLRIVAVSCLLGVSLIENSAPGVFGNDTGESQPVAAGEGGGDQV